MNRARASVVVLIAAALLAGGYAWWHSRSTRADWAASIAAPPDLAAFPGELRERVQTLTARARAARDVAALGELSRLYHANGFLREAALGYKGSTRFDPRDPRWPHLLAHILAGTGELAEAVPLWRKVTELAPDYLPAQLRLGEAMLKTNQPAAAADVYASALQQAPADPYALFGLARCELQQERWTAARERLQQAATARPDFGAAWNLLATVYERLGNADGAASAQARARGTRRFREMADPWLDALLDECYDVYRLRVAGGAAAASGDARSGLPWLERAVRLAPDDAALHRQLGDVYAELRDFPHAREYLERAAALAPDDDVSYLRMIDACNATGDSEGAERALATGIEHCPRSVGLRFAQGKELANAGRLEEALAAFAIARDLQPETAGAYLEIAAIHFRSGRDAAGVAALEDALVHVPDHPPTLLVLAQHAIASNDAEAAARWLGRARSREPNPGGGLEAIVGEFQRRFGRPPW